MSRINIYSYDEVAGTKVLEGWFNPDTSEWIREGTEWDGNNNRGIISGLQCGYEGLYRTRGDRWVRYYNARSEFNGPETYEFFTDDQAREWLLRAKWDDLVKEYFGEIEPERGPGRPAIGEPINVRLGDALLARVDACAKLDGMTRAEWVRKACETAADQVASRPYGPDGSPNPYQR
jgi:hypothetical protein